MQLFSLRLCSQQPSQLSFLSRSQVRVDLLRAVPAGCHNPLAGPVVHLLQGQHVPGTRCQGSGCAQGDAFSMHHAGEAQPAQVVTAVATCIRTSNKRQPNGLAPRRPSQQPTATLSTFQTHSKPRMKASTKPANKQTNIDPNKRTNNPPTNKPTTNKPTNQTTNQPNNQPTIVFLVAWASCRVRAG